MLLDPQIQAAIKHSILPTPAGPYLALEPDVTQNILSALRDQMATLGAKAASVSILTSAAIRRYVRKLIELEFPGCQVLSRADLEPDTRIVPVARVKLGENGGGQR